MWKDFNTECYNPYENPDCICWRDVVNDFEVSPWYKWQGINQNLTQEEFVEQVIGCGLSPDKLVLRAYEEGKGIVIDYGHRKQFWIPNPVGWDLEKLRVELDERIKRQKVKIKPCPFCGGEAKLMVMDELRYGGDEGFIISCLKCGMNTASVNGTYSSFQEDVVRAWNSRVN